MSTVALQVLEAIVAAHEVEQVTGGYETVTKPTGLDVHRMRQVPIDSDTLPATVVYPAGNVPELAHIDSNINRLSFWCEHRVQISGDDVPDEAVDPLIVWSHRCLKSDETLGGLAHQIIEGETEWDEEIAEAGYAAARVRWTVEFFTQETDPRH